MKLKRILALAVSLAMVLSIVPAFSLTAGAATTYAQGAEWFAIDFDLVDIGAEYSDVGITDADGNVFTGFTNAWRSGDGIYYPDGERFYLGTGEWDNDDGLTFKTDYNSHGNKRISHVYGSRGFVSNHTEHLRIEVTVNSTASTYSVKFFADNNAKAFASGEYSGTVNGVSDPSAWKGGNGTASPTYSNFMVTTDQNAHIASGGKYYKRVGSNLAYNGDFAATTNSSDSSYITVDSWKGGYLNNVHQDLNTKAMPEGSGRNDSGANMHFYYTAATDTASAYVTTPPRSAMTSSDWGSYPWNAGDGYSYAVINNWFKDSTGAYVKATSGSKYIISFDIMATSTSSEANKVVFTATANDGSSYESSLPGTIAAGTILDNPITSQTYITKANAWNTLSSVVTANSDGYFVFQLAGANDWGQVSVTNFNIYEVQEYVSDTRASVTVKYSVGGTVIDSLTETGSYDTTAEPGATFPEKYYSPNGTNTLYYAKEQTLAADQTIEMTALENWAKYTEGEALKSGTKAYKIKGTNLIPNGNFAYGLNGWYAGDNGAASSSYFTVDSSAGTLKNTAGGGSGTANGLYRSWKVTQGTTYVLTFNSDTKIDNGYIKTNSVPEFTGAASVQSGIAQGDTVYVFKAAADYIAINFGWFENVTVKDFALYEVEEDTAAYAKTTIHFVDGKGTKLQDDVIVDGFVGDEINLTDTSIVPETITYNNNLYSKDSTNPTSFTAAANTNETSITYTTTEITHAEAPAITVIKGNVPILPKTATAYTGTNANAGEMDVTWTTDVTNLAEGNKTVEGYLTSDTTVPATVEVTVLPETFKLSDMTQDTGTQKFPSTLKDEFVIEFDFNSTNIADNWIYISMDGALWGSGQVGMGTSNDQVGTYKFQPETDAETITVTTGKTYRIIATIRPGTNTYDAVMTECDGTTGTGTVVKRVTGYSFRTNSAEINSIVATGNGHGGAFTVSNIKVYSSKLEETVTAYSVTVTGSVTDSYTEKAVSAEKVSIPYYAGNILKTRTVDGTNITYTYEATTVSPGAWAIRNNTRTDDGGNQWLTEMKYIGSHNSFADTASAKQNEGQYLYGQSLQDSASSIFASDYTTGTELKAAAHATTAINSSRTQKHDALEQLNAGVRYFDIRLSRQSSGEFWTIHGPAFENFRGIAATIAQFARENPGEVILLDFQTTYDALYDNNTYTVVTDDGNHYGDKKGDDNKYVYDALTELLTETGIMDFVPAAGKWDNKYNDITENGKKAVILVLAKQRGANCNDRFIDRKTYMNADADTGNTYLEDSEYSKIVEYIDSQYTKINQTGANYGVIHAYTTGGTLLDTAASNNPSWQTAANFKNWFSGKGDILLLNDAATAAETYLPILSMYNRDNFDDQYTNTVNGVGFDGATSSVPFSSVFTVDSVPMGGAEVSIDNVAHRKQTKYTIDFMRYRNASADITGESFPLGGEVKITFPKASTDNSTVDVLLDESNKVLTTADPGKAVSYPTTSLGTYVIATKEAPYVTMTINYVAGTETLYSETKKCYIGDLAYDIKASDRQWIKLGDKAYIVSAAAQSYTVTGEETDAQRTKTVTLGLVERYAVITDALVSANGGQIYGAKMANGNKIFASAGQGSLNGAEYDDDNVRVVDTTPSSTTWSRVGLLQFPVVDLVDGQAAIAVLPVDAWNDNTFSNGNDNVRLSAYAMNTSEWVDYDDDTVYNPMDTTKLLNEKIVFSEKSNKTYTEVKFDVTEFMKAAKNANMTTISVIIATAWGGCQFVQSEDAVAAGTQEGRAAYIDVVDANTVSVTGAQKLTKSGTSVDLTNNAATIAVPTGASIKVTWADGTIAYVDGDVVTAVSGGDVTPFDNITAAKTIQGDGMFVELVDGAQVRYGQGVDSTTGKIKESTGTDDATAGSGLRFIATIDKNSHPLAGKTGVVPGVRIEAADGAGTHVDIDAVNYQKDDGSVFTVALVNLLESNYNRVFTATPYVKINGGEPILGTQTVSRSIYEVAAGILVQKTTEGTDTHTPAPDDVINKVLNAYVNQVGIRLKLKASGDAKAATTGTGSYVGGKTGTPDVFFNVNVVYNNDTANPAYTITITAANENVKFASFWQDYIRINNNNSTVKTNIVTDEANTNDTQIVFTFYPNGKPAV